VLPGIELGLHSNLGFPNIFLLYGLCNDQISDNSVGVATRLQVQGARNRGLITYKGIKSFSSAHRQKRLWGPPRLFNGRSFKLTIHFRQVPRLRMNGALPPHHGLHEYSFAFSFTHSVGWYSSVGTATRCGMDGPENDFWWGRDFPHPFRPALRPT
jgi:hypothetical protein